MVRLGKGFGIAAAGALLLAIPGVVTAARTATGQECEPKGVAAVVKEAAIPVPKGAKVTFVPGAGPGFRITPRSVESAFAGTFKVRVRITQRNGLTRSVPVLLTVAPAEGGVGCMIGPG